MNLKTCLLFALLLLSGVLGLSGPASADDRPVIFASNYPLYFFAREIAGDAMDVRMPEIQGDPAYWAPNGDQAAALQAVDLILLNGAGFEKWLDFVSLREERLVDTTAGLKDRLLPLEEATVHQHGPDGEHSHAGTAFTTWLDPHLASAQAEIVAAALGELAPEGRQRFAQGLDSLQARLQQLDEGLQQAFAGLGEQPVVFSHPVYQYLQARYRLNGRSVHWEADQSPGTKAWVDFVNLLMEHPATLLIWEAEPLVETRDRLLEQGIDSVVFEPAGNRPAHGDYFAVMERNRQRLQDLPRFKP